MRVLVTGGAGLIGSHLVDLLLGAGYEVTVLDNLEPEVHPRGAPEWIREAARFVEGDIRDPLALDRALDDCTGIFHLAAYGGFTPEFSKITDVNATGTTRLFEAVRRQGNIERVVAASSMAVYGEGWYRCDEHGPFHGQPRSLDRLHRGEWELLCPDCGRLTRAAAIPTRSATRPAGVYACSKAFTERVTLCEGRDLGIATAALRYFLTFGERQSVHNPYSGICSIFSTRLLNGLAPVVYEDGAQSRDMIHAADVAAATLCVFEDERMNGRVFNVCRGAGISIAEFARRLAAAYGVSIEPECGRRFRPMDNRHMLGDGSETEALGWRPKVDLDQGLERYVRWIRSLGGVGESFGAAERRLRGAGVVRDIAKVDET